MKRYGVGMTSHTNHERQSRRTPTNSENIDIGHNSAMNIKQASADTTPKKAKIGVIHGAQQASTDEPVCPETGETDIRCFRRTR